MLPNCRYNRFRIAFWTLAVLLLFPAGTARAQWVITDLGALTSDPGDPSVATQINDAGQIVGQSPIAGGYIHAFRTAPYTPIVSSDDLGTVPDAYGEGSGFNSFANAINSPGHVVGYGDVPYGGAPVEQGFFYGASGMAPLDRYDPGSYASATAINDSDNIVGFAFSSLYGGERAVMWAGGGPSLYDLNTGLPSGSPWILTDAYGINASGHMVGIGGLSSALTGWVWFGYPSVPVAIGAGGPTYSPMDINDSDLVTGWGGPTGHAFLWSGGSITDLGTLMNPFSFGRKINIYGQIVGWDTPFADGAVSDGTMGAPPSHAFLWLPSPAYSLPAGMTDLNSVLPSGSGWLLLAAGGINASGKIVGIGYHGGIIRGFLLSSPSVKLKTLTLKPASVTGGASVTGTVVLTGPAPSGGATVTLGNTNAAAAAPSSVTVPAGATSATFTVTTVPVTMATRGTVSASYGGVTKSAALMVKTPVLLSLALSPGTVKGGGSVTGTVKLNGVAASALSVSLTTTNPAATVPGSVMVPAGASSATFTIPTTPVSSTTSGIVSATFSVTKSKTLTVTP
ncbi:MAG TPA: hypothetical protein VKT32_04705 [Chthonomonadaceae bacterium]|nr:hypothetical protein [Chthonomonadaceae bacterium]